MDEATRLTEWLRRVEEQIPDPHEGLPEPVFEFLTRLTPMINVDLLIKNEKGHTLLAWRDDKTCGQGWHVPGGIIRYQETLEERIRKVAETEVGSEVIFDAEPAAIHQIILDQVNRGHFLSLLYRCRLPGSYVIDNRGRKESDAGYLRWFDHCPENLVRGQAGIYREYI